MPLACEGTERRDVRVVEGARLESVYTSKAYQGFESLSLRKRKWSAQAAGCPVVALSSRRLAKATEGGPEESEANDHFRLLLSPWDQRS